MTLLGEHVLLRTHLPEADRTPHVPTYQRIVKAAREQKLAGCTVLKGILGYGPYGLLEPSAWSIVEHVPVVVEIVDQASRIKDFIEATLANLIPTGLSTLERAHVMMYRHRNQGEPNSLRLGALLQTPLSTLPTLQPGANMTINQTGIQLRIFIGESDKLEGKPLAEAIVQHARQQGLAGATVLRGVEGFGANSVVHKAKLLEMSADLPIVIEIIDAQPQIEQFLAWLEGVVHEGMITMEHVTILLHRHAGA